MKTLELRPAYEFVCLSCGKAGFRRGVTRVLDPAVPDDAQVIRLVSGLGPADPLPTDGLVIHETRPARVECKACGDEFRTIAPGGCEDFAED